MRTASPDDLHRLTGLRGGDLTIPPATSVTVEGTHERNPMGQLHEYRGIVPTVADSAILFATAELTGDVVVGERTIIGAGVKIIGDSHGPVRIGDDVQILENTVLHLLPDNDLVLDNGVIVGPGAMIHGCRIGAHSVVEPGAIVCDGSEVGADCVVARAPSSSSARASRPGPRSTASRRSRSGASATRRPCRPGPGLPATSRTGARAGPAGDAPCGASLGRCVMPHWLGIGLGLIILVFTWVIVVSTLVLPRPLTGPVRLSVWATRSTRRLFFTLAHFRRTYEGKDAVLAPIGPVALVAQLAAWLVLLGIGFSIMLVPYTDDLGHAASEVGAAMFTLGLARSARFTNDTIVIAAAASGFVVIALQIAYLPALYAAFSRRESLIAMLVSRAGEPSWGPEILIRHQLVGIVDSLPAFYGDWEQWAADFSESHSTYPVLLVFRSPDPWSSWAVALLAVLDAAAMQLALNPTSAPSQARLSLRMGYTALRRISDGLGWRYEHDPMPDDPIQLTFEEFERAVLLLRDVGFDTERDADEAWPHFRGWRVNYEALAYRWAARVMAPPAPWSGPRPGLGQQTITPQRPPHRSPDSPDPGVYRRPDFDA